MIGTQHPWHDLSPGENLPFEVTAVIEIPAGSRTKYELDKPSGLIKVDRVLFSSIHYPANYGLIPQTYYTDHDPLDILVICTENLVPLTIVQSRVIGMMEMIDGGVQDNKIIAVASHDISLKHIANIEDLPPHTLHEIKNFFEDYKKLENKKVEVLGFSNRESAYNCINDSLISYTTEIVPQLKNK
ncbi:inorganic diphosphatase [Chryseobacterium sp. Y16C]|uniref:inorganic diphosphatase n=1 Tax=Chryseobacterium sp. Y16C TaxID=2920939 RepID=UPI001F0AD1A9|nr:inorganic diphosphatase [Chryseobacterium sp. Y16C]UMQ43157.1 inorganic diphosphatase [Chryseobacterium sp. Y16C]